MMKKLSILILQLFLVVSMFGQARNFFPVNAVSGPNLYTDDFEAYTESSIDNQGSWVVARGDILIIDVSGDKRYYGSVTNSLAYYNSPVNDDQFSQVVVDSKTGFRSPGPAVRVTANDGYYWFSENSQSYLVAIDDGDQRILVSGGNDWVVGSTYKLEIEGNQLSCYKNGVLDTSIGGAGTYTDTHANKKDSGSVGIGYRGTDSQGTGDDFVGGDL